MEAVAFSEVVRNWAIVIGASLGVLIAIWRGISLSRQAKAAQEQARIADRVHATDVFSRAVEFLDDERVEKRLGAIYTLRELHFEYANLAEPIEQMLLAVLRERTASGDARLENEDTRAISRFLETGLARKDET